MQSVVQRALILAVWAVGCSVLAQGDHGDQQWMVLDSRQIWAPLPDNEVGEILTARESYQYGHCVYQYYLNKFGRPIRHGRFTGWSFTGEKWECGSYRHGVKHGLWNWYEKDGTKSSQVTYEKGTLHGDWVFWHGQGKTVVPYQNGRTHGTIKVWNKEGVVVATETWAEGELVSPTAAPEEKANQ